PCGFWSIAVLQCGCIVLQDRIMELPEFFSVADGLAYYCPVAQVSFPEATELLSTALAACHALGVRKLLINGFGLTGFAPPRVFERFEFAQRMANEARGVTIAIVVRAELIDKQKFGTTVATNRGVRTNVFSNEAEARAWLTGEGAAPTPPTPQ